MPVYLRCNSAHYFRPTGESGARCPLDGWSFPGFEAVSAAEESLVADGEAVTIEALKQRGAPGDALQRAAVIEFGSDDAAFDAISPEGFVIAGRFLSVVEAPAALK